MNDTSLHAAVPGAIARKLRLVRSWKRWVHLATAALLALVVLLAAMCVAMLVDYLATLYDSRWRYVLTNTALSTAAITSVGWLLVAWRRGMQWSSVAGDVDREFPELEERWTTMTRLEPATAKDPQLVHPAMFRRVAAEASKWEPHVDPQEIVSLSPLVRTMLCLTAITLVLAVAVILDARQTVVLMRRFLSPGSLISVTELVDVPGNTVVGKGEPLTLAANVKGTPVDRATLFLNTPDNERAIKLVGHGNDPVSFSHNVRSVEEPFTYRFRAGDGQTEWYQVDVADRPEIDKLELTITPPGYTRREAKTFDRLPRRVTAIEGSVVELAIRPTIAVDEVELRARDKRLAALSQDAEGWYRWRIELKESVSFEPKLTESHGLSNRKSPRCAIEMVKDKPPAVKVLTPDSDVAVRPDDTIDITFAAQDDVGIGSAELVVYGGQNERGEPQELATMPIDLGEQVGERTLQGQAELDLSKFEVADGMELSYQIRVREDRGQFAAARTAAASPAGQSQAPAGQTAPPQDAMARNASGQNASSSDPASSDGSVASTTPADNPPQLKMDFVEQGPQPGPGQMAGAQQSNTPPSGANPSPSELAGGSPNAQSGQFGQPQSPNQSGSESMAGSPSAQPPGASAVTPPGMANADEKVAAARGEGAGAKQNAKANGEGSPRAEARSPQADGMNAEPRVAESERRGLSPGGASDPATQEPQAGEPQGSPGAAQPSPESMAGEPQGGGNPPSAGSPQQPANPPGSAMANQTNQNAASQNQSSPQTPSPSSSGQPQASAQAQSSSGQPSGSDPPPGDSMTRRSLDVAQQSSSDRMRLKVDEWAGSFSGQQRRKLEVAISPRLAALDEALAKAERTSLGVLDAIGAGAEWRAAHERELSSAEESTEDAQKVIGELSKLTKDSPYAFIGLQVSDIGLAHVEPARTALWTALEADGDGRTANIREAHQHLVRARELVAELRGQFERSKREFQLAESVERVKKMYQVYVENSMRLLPTSEEDPKYYQRKMAEFELDEEYLKRLQEVMKMREEMRAELARILADDPRLLRRLMDSIRNRSENLRTELATLTAEQKEFNREVRAWSETDAVDRPRIAQLLLMRQLRKSSGIATAAGELQDRYKAWLPLDRKSQEGGLATATESIQELATAATGLSAHAGQYILEATRPKVRAAETPDGAEGDGEAKPQADVVAEENTNRAPTVEELVAEGQRVYETAVRAETVLRQLSANQGDLEIAAFAANRLADTRTIIGSSSAWVRQVRAHMADKYSRAAEVEQYRLAMKTEELAGKLATLEQSLAGAMQRQDGSLPEAIANKSREFIAALDKEASPNQLAAVYALHVDDMPRATERQLLAGGALEKAERLYDEVMKLAIAEMDKLPVQDPIEQLLEDPTLDELLARLEQEQALEQLLGIPPRPSNLRVVDDWLSPNGALATAMRNRQWMQQQMNRENERMRRQLDRAYRRAIARALRETKPKTKIALPKRATLSDWNKLLSELKDDVGQGRDKAPPEQYRRAIEQYFAQISKEVAQDEQPQQQ